MGRARGLAGREGAVGRPVTTPPPPVCRHLWVVPHAGRNPPKKGKGSRQPPGGGAVAPLVERF